VQPEAVKARGMPRLFAGKITKYLKSSPDTRRHALVLAGQVHARAEAKATRLR
jgi:hypothetical protein